MCRLPYLMTFSTKPERPDRAVASKVTRRPSPHSCAAASTLSGSPKKGRLVRVNQNHLGAPARDVAGRAQKTSQRHVSLSRLRALNELVAEGERIPHVCSLNARGSWKPAEGSCAGTSTASESNTEESLDNDLERCRATHEPRESRLCNDILR